MVENSVVSGVFMASLNKYELPHIPAITSAVVFEKKTKIIIKNTTNL